MDRLGTLQGFAERRGVDFDPTDLKARRALDDASAFIRGYTHQDITLVESEEVALDGNGLTVLLLPQIPVVAVTEVSTLDADDVATEVTEYRVAEFGRLKRLDGYTWPAGHANVVLTYDHGYSVVPPDIAAVCYELAAENYVATGSGEITQESIGSYSVTYEASSAGTSELPEAISSILNLYRVPR
jgi:hypothetical protein